MLVKTGSCAFSIMVNINTDTSCSLLVSHVKAISSEVNVNIIHHQQMEPLSLPYADVFYHLVLYTRYHFHNHNNTNLKTLNFICFSKQMHKFTWKVFQLTVSQKCTEIICTKLNSLYVAQQLNMNDTQSLISTRLTLF